jgi:hypothetical protein
MSSDRSRRGAKQKLQDAVNTLAKRAASQKEVE